MVTLQKLSAAILLLGMATGGGCSALSPPAADVGTPPSGRWLAGIRRQVRQAVEEIRADVAVLDDDGLDGFGPAAAREIRSMRAELQR